MEQKKLRHEAYGVECLAHVIGVGTTVLVLVGRWERERERGEGERRRGEGGKGKGKDSADGMEWKKGWSTTPKELFTGYNNKV